MMWVQTKNNLNHVEDEMPALILILLVASKQQYYDCRLLRPTMILVLVLVLEIAVMVGGGGGGGGERQWTDPNNLVNVRV